MPIRVPTRDVAQIDVGRAPIGEQQINVPEAAFGGGVGRAVQQLGGQLERTAFTLAEIDRELQLRNDKALALDAVRGARREADIFVYGTTEQGEHVPGVVDRQQKEAFGAAEQAADEIFPSIEDRFTKDMNDQQRALFAREWEKERDVYMRKITTHEASQRQSFRDSQTTSELSDFEQRGIEAAGRVQDDWRSWPQAMAEVDTSVERLLAQGMPADEITKRRNEIITNISGAAIRGWYDEQPDPYEAAATLSRGELDDPALDKMWGNLDTDQRDAVLGGAITNNNKLASLRNDAKREEEEATKQVDQTNLQRIMFDSTISNDQKWEMFDGLKTSTTLSLGSLERVDRFLREGDQAFGQDLARSVAELKTKIWRREITTIDGAMEHVGEGVSWSTFEGQILPLLEARKDDETNEILREYSARLGVGTSTIFSNANDSTRKIAQFEGDLRSWMRQNPKGDARAQAQTIFDRIGKQTGTQEGDAVIALLTDYRNSLAEGDMQKAAKTLDVLRIVMKNAQMVTQAQAMDPNFDPEEVVRKQQGNE